MDLYLTGKAADLLDDWKYCAKTLKPEELVRDAMEIWRKRGSPEETEIRQALFQIYLQGAFANLRPNEVHLKLVGNHWMVIHWCHRQACEPLVAGVVFAYREDTTSDYRYFPIPGFFKVDPATGDITTEYEGEELRFPAWIGRWPDQLVNINKYVAFGMLETLLTPNDENPLTMLAASNHQPCKGAAKQIISKLTKIRDRLNMPEPIVHY